MRGDGGEAVIGTDGRGGAWERPPLVANLEAVSVLARPWDDMAANAAFQLAAFLWIGPSRRPQRMGGAIPGGG